MRLTTYAKKNSGGFYSIPLKASVDPTTARTLKRSIEQLAKGAPKKIISRAGRYASLQVNDATRRGFKSLPFKKRKRVARGTPRPTSVRKSLSSKGSYKGRTVFPRDGLGYFMTWIDISKRPENRLSVLFEYGWTPVVGFGKGRKKYGRTLGKYHIRGRVIASYHGTQARIDYANAIKTMLDTWNSTAGKGLAYRDLVKLGEAGAL
jgi:hypothetical protein|tara:strand:+ start:2444 stop:3061 length:618 start_codon:yes stop_codon:yes gene_type:complete